MASARPLSADDLRLEVKRRFSAPTRDGLSAESLQREPSGLARAVGLATAAAAATPTTARSPNSLGTALDSAERGKRWSRVANAARFQQTVNGAEQVADVAGAAAQLMRLSSTKAFAGDPGPRNTPGPTRAALLADITTGGRTRTGLKHVSEQDKARPNADPHASMLADIVRRAKEGATKEGGGASPSRGAPKERRGSANAPPKWMLGVHRMLGVQFAAAVGLSQEVIAEGPTPLGQVSTASSNSAPCSVV